MKHQKFLAAFVSVAFFLLLSPSVLADNIIQNPGFETTTSWVLSGSGSVSIRPTSFLAVPVHSGSSSGNTCGDPEACGTFGSLTQSLTPTLVSSIANQAGSFSIWIYLAKTSSDGSGTVDIKITGAAGHILHYTSSPLTDTATDAYIQLPTLTTGQWVQLSRNFVDDWTAKGFPLDDKITQISLISSGNERCRYYKWADDVICSEHGQNIFWDDVSLNTGQIPQQTPTQPTPQSTVLSPPPSTVTIKVVDTKDTYVFTGTKFVCWPGGCVCTDNYCSNNYGTSSNILLEEDSYNNFVTTGYIGFDNLASISQYLNSVTNAQLCLYASSIDGFYICGGYCSGNPPSCIYNYCNINQIPVSVGAVSSNWDENSLTWAQTFNLGRDQFFTNGPTGQTINVYGQSYACSDVTQGIQQGFSSWSLSQNKGPWSVAYLNSKENTAGNSPYLQLTLKNIQKCTLVSANLVPHCTGFKGACQAGDTIEMDGSFLGDCSSANVLQIDASSSDGLCTMKYSGGLINGITSSSLTYNGAQVTGFWQIPSPVFTACIGKTINAKTASFWQGFPNSGTQVSSAVGSGSFPFVGPYYTITVSPTQQQITVGGQTSYTVTVTSIYGFSGTVSLSLSGWGRYQCFGRGADRDCDIVGGDYQFGSQQISLSSGGSVSTTLTLLNARQGTYNLQITGVSGSLTISSNSFTVQVTPACPVCQQASTWSSCVNGQQSRTNYKCDASTNYQCQSFTETQSCCPTCSGPSVWSTCSNSQQSRTNYKCDSSTNYQCQAFTETQTCTVPLQSSTISLPNGWNLISFPVSQLTVTNSNCKASDFVFYGWNSATQKWDTVTDTSALVAGRAYWILTSQACQISYSGQAPLQTNQISLVSGWNAIGATNVVNSISSVKGSCNIVNAQSWDATSQSWVTATQLVPLNGYWIQVSSNCNFS